MRPSSASSHLPNFALRSFVIDLTNEDVPLGTFIEIVMKPKNFSFATASAVAAVCFSVAIASAPAKSATDPKAAFEKLKTLAGEWRGTEGEKDKGQELTVLYKITSSGSVVMETLFPGGDHEMVTLYHMDGDKLVLTHYCALANQPTMALTDKSSPDELVFDFASGSNMNSKKDMHMHAMRMRFEGKDTLATEWDLFRDGKKVDSKKFFLTRKI